MTAQILALDFGGTKLAAASWVRGEQKWYRYQRRLSPLSSSAESDLAIMRSLIHDILLHNWSVKQRTREIGYLKPQLNKRVGLLVEALATPPT